MIPDTDDITAFLVSDEVIDWKNTAVQTLARSLTHDTRAEDEKVRKLFEWVRDEIPHSRDIKSEVVTCAASEVLGAGTGICFAKSHLLAALLRSIGIPAGFCYQVLRSEGCSSQMVLHGLNGIYLTSIGKWVRVDPRGNTNGICVQFSLEEEQLAFPMDPAQGEFIYNWIYNKPVPDVIAVLKKYTIRSKMWPYLPQRISDQQAPGVREKIKQ